MTDSIRDDASDAMEQTETSPSLPAPLPAPDPTPIGLERARVADPFDELPLGLLSSLPVDVPPPPPVTESLGLAEESRLAVLSEFQARAELWGRLDRLEAQRARFEHFARRTTESGARRAEPSAAPSQDPEAEFDQLRARLEQSLAEQTDLTTRSAAKKLELQGAGRKRGLRSGKRARVVEDELGQLRSQADATRELTRSTAERGLLVLDQAEVHLRDLIDANRRTLTEIERNVSIPEHAPWEMSRWMSWRPPQSPRTSELRLGVFTEGRSGEPLAVPCVAPLIGGGRALVLASEGEHEHTIAMRLLQSLVVRTSAMLPQQSRYTLLDPAGNGLAFPMARHLDKATLSVNDMRRDLDEVTAEIRRIVTTYLDPGHPSFEQVPESMRVSESYHFVVAADFPNGYDLRTAEALQSIARTGPRAGVYVILHLHRDHVRHAPGDLSRYGVENPWLVEMGQQMLAVGDSRGTITFDEPPPAALQDLVFGRIRSMPRRDSLVSWQELNSDVDWWTGSADRKVSAPIGRHGANDPLELWFGTDEVELRSCVHGVLGAATGAGKSTFLHNLICGLAIRYSPAELRFVLIDGKYGVEFRPYRTLPHADVVSLHTSPALARSVLDDLVDEMERRNTVFAEHGVADLAAYRDLGQPSGVMPRKVLIIDEYQQLFEDDRDGEASANLLRISQQGRSAGIHMLLASQRMDPGGMLNRNEIFGNIHLRMAMQLSQSDVAGLGEFGTSGRRMIAMNCDRAGRIVVNDRAGDDNANRAGKAALLEPDQRDQLVAQLAAKATRELHPSGVARTVVLDGGTAPAFIENPFVQLFGRWKSWPTADQLDQIARATAASGGLGVPDWLTSEQPLPLFLGQEFNVRGQALAVLRRRPAENLLVVGEHSPARLGMLATAVMSAALVAAPSRLKVWITDRSTEGTPWSSVLPRMIDMLTVAGFEAACGHRAHDAASLIDLAEALVEYRRGLPESRLPHEQSILVVLSDPDRVAPLLRDSDAYGTTESELGAKLRTVLSAGPNVGVHVLLGVSSLGALRTVLPDRLVQQTFRHRAVMQVPEDDSFVLVRSTRATTLQADGTWPIAAALFDSHRQSVARFKPYTSDPELRSDGVGLPLLDQLGVLGDWLAERGRA